MWKPRAVFKYFDHMIKDIFKDFQAEHDYTASSVCSLVLVHREIIIKIIYI